MQNEMTTSPQDDVIAMLNKELSDLLRFKIAIEQVFNHVVITDKEQKILFANMAAQKMTGYSVDELIGSTPRIWGGQMGKEFYQDMWRTIAQEKKPFKAQVKNRRKNGDLYYAILTITPLIGADGEIQGYVGVEENVSGLKIIDIFFETSHELMCIANAKGYFEKLNPAFEAMLGYPLEEMLSQPFLSFIHEDDRAATEKEINRLGSGIKTIDFTNRYRRKSGEYVWLQWNATPWEGKIFATARNVTKEHEVDRMKTEFIALASHQLRTPLTATKWFLERVAGGEGGTVTEKQKELLIKTYESNERTISLVNALLNISRIESGRIIMDSENINIARLFNEVIEETKLKYLDKKQVVTLEAENSDLLVPTDKKLLRNILINLLTNAMKYSPEKSVIKTSIRKEGGLVMFKISDHGIGISANDQRMIFTRFFRTQQAIRYDAEGTGLGLYLTKQIVQSLGGTIGFESEDGKGTTFWFSIPEAGTPMKTGDVELVA